MKPNQIFAALTILSMLLLASTSHAIIQVYNSGNWSSTTPNAPWKNGVLPSTNDIVEVYDNVIITNDMTNAVCSFLDSSYGTNENGMVRMAANSTLTVMGQNEGFGAQTLGQLDANATNCTVIYGGNAFWAKRTNYWNLVFSGWGDFYNSTIPLYPNPPPMFIWGNFTVNGTNVPSDQTNLYTGCYVECGTNITIDGNLYIGSSNAWDCSDSIVTVLGNTTCAGILWDKDSSFGSNIFNNLTILQDPMVNTNLNDTLVIKMGTTGPTNLSPTGVYGPGYQGAYGGSLYVLDVAQWAIGGNFTNNGIVGFGTNYGSIDYTGTGVVAGSNLSNEVFTIPTMEIDGNYEIGTTITLTTNYPTINGTIEFDLKNTNQIVLNAGTNWFWYSTNGTLDVINSGPAPVAGNTYQFFDNIGNTNYGGGYATNTFPSLSAGLSWVNNLTNNGSITVAGPPARPIITSSHYVPATLQFTLTWTSVAGAMYTVQETPSLSPVAWSSLQTNIPSGGTSTTTTVTMPAGTKGFLRILVQ